MYFGIREKVALLVILATAATALLVANLLSNKAEDVLRDHELVDLGDEAELTGWEMIDQIEGLRDDLINLAFDPAFQQEILTDRSQEDLLDLCRSLCRRYWDKYLLVDLVTFENESSGLVQITKKAEIDEKDLWLPGPDARAGARLHVSPIQRLHVERNDLPTGPTVKRWEPVIWAVAPLDPTGSSPELNKIYLRILMSLHEGPSPRHLMAMETADGELLLRHDEAAPANSGNDAVFHALTTDPLLLAALEEREPRDNGTEEPQEEPKVDRLVRMEQIPLVEPYYFQEGTPGRKLSAEINFESDEAISEMLDRLEAKAAPYGRVGGAQGGVREVRLLAQSPENLAELRKVAAEELAETFPKAFDGIDWRNVVKCDEIHSWAVRLLVGNGEEQLAYIIHYAVLDDELASSIKYEMLSLQRLALLVAGGFGIIGFLFAMHFIQPLKEMTRFAQRLTDSPRANLYKQVTRLAERLDIKRRDEVGEIARASKRLFEELVSFQAELEHRVAERTRELRHMNTELEDANEKLKSLSNEKDAFVAKVSHDLRQPLNAIFLQVEALKLSQLDDGQKKDVQRIHDHAARELKLVNDILEYQKIIMGAETLEKDQIDVKALLEDLLHSFEPALKDKPVSLSLKVGEKIGQVIADDRRLRQVLGNLIGNACKFTSEGSIVIEARPREVEHADWVEFTVTDTGRGMSPEEQTKAFIPFVSNKKDNAGGTGLGLSICRELVTQMGGKIGFVSELGKGTHFSIFIPRFPTSKHYRGEEIRGAQESTIAPALTEQLPRSGTILVIEDDESVRALLTRILEGDGYKVISAEDGNAGLALARNHQPDAITLDVVMPGGRDGWQVLRELKDAPETQSIPIIMVSVMADQENGLALEVEDFLAKPVDVDRLRRVIARVTQQSPQRNLLLVDDDEASLKSMSRILNSAGWQSTHARDGSEALSVLEKTRPAAIILDLMMPGMDGFEFLQEVQRHEHLRSIPVIVISGKVPSNEEREFLRDRVTTVLQKGKNSARDLLDSINARLRQDR